MVSYHRKQPNQRLLKLHTHWNLLAMRWVHVHSWSPFQCTNDGLRFYWKTKSSSCSIVHGPFHCPKWETVKVHWLAFRALNQDMHGHDSSSIVRQFNNQSFSSVMIASSARSFRRWISLMIQAKTNALCATLPMLCSVEPIIRGSATCRCSFWVRLSQQRSLVHLDDLRYSHAGQLHDVSTPFSVNGTTGLSRLSSIFHFQSCAPIFLTAIRW